MPICPVCASQFTVDLAPRPPARGRDTDFRPHDPRGDPDAASVFACATCRYASARRGWFVDGAVGEEEEEDSEELGAPREPPEGDDLDDLRRYVRGPEYVEGLSIRDEPTDAQRFVLAARVLEFLKEDDPLAVADLYLRASWCARAQGERSLERGCQQEAIARYQVALDQSKVPSEERARITYLVGELSRRIGDFARAVDCFHEVEKLVDPDEDGEAFLGALARRQEALATIKSDVNAIISPEDDLEPS